MRLHFLRHLPFEDSESIGIWATDRGHTVSNTLLLENETLPNLNDFDWLFIMGGLMSVNEEKKHPWLVEEKKFIENAIAREKIILGLCLGAQLIADVLGAAVFKSKYKEIGWFPVSLTNEAANSTIYNKIPKKFTAFHSHSDVFELPAGSVRIAESEGCVNQAFEYNKRVISLQFHLEFSEENILKLIDNCRFDLGKGKYIQTQNEITSHHRKIKGANNILNLLLDNIERELNR